MPDQPKHTWASEEPDHEPAAPVRRSRSAIAALVLGVLAIPLALTVYLGALVGLLGLGLGLVGLLRTRGGRALGRGMALAGMVTALIGLAVAIALGALSLRTYRDCEAKLGHPPTRAEWDDCVHSSDS
jgi:hypothetical protein